MLFLYTSVLESTYLSLNTSTLRAILDFFEEKYPNDHGIDLVNKGIGIISITMLGLLLSLLFFSMFITQFYF